MRKARRNPPPRHTGNEEEIPEATIARRWFREHVVKEVRMGCKYDIIQPYWVSEYTRLPNGSPWGCVAGSVWVPGEDGVLRIDHGNVLHKSGKSRQTTIPMLMLMLMIDIKTAEVMQPREIAPNCSS